MPMYYVSCVWCVWCAWCAPGCVQEVSEEIEDDPTGGRVKWEQGRLGGAPNKLEQILQFHVGDTAMALQKASLIPGMHRTPMVMHTWNCTLALALQKASLVRGTKRSRWLA